jgi:hypothetical protein
MYEKRKEGKDENKHCVLQLDCPAVCQSIELSSISLENTLDKNDSKWLTTVSTGGEL